MAWTDAQRTLGRDDMTMYLLTPEEHAQIADALNLPSLKTTSMLIQRDEALAMLKAMKPVEPCAYEEKATKFANGSRLIYENNTRHLPRYITVTPLYAKEQQ